LTDAPIARGCDSGCGTESKPHVPPRLFEGCDGREVRCWFTEDSRMEKFKVLGGKCCIP
jgi:hypothetical protein